MFFKGKDHFAARILAKNPLFGNSEASPIISPFLLPAILANMDSIVALRWSWMNVLSRKRYDLLKEKFKTLENALDHVSLEMLRELGAREDTAMGAMNRLEEFDAEAHQKELLKRGLTLLTIEDEAYPLALLNIPDAPVFLYARGDLGILNQPCLALVGTRDMSEYGKRITGHIVPPLISAGIVTVSGLAAGIDAEVARETIRAGGKTVAVLGHGFGTMYPKAHIHLADDIVNAGGLILSELALDIQPDKFTFPARNRIIAGLSLGTVVLEAAEKSGSLITADLALDYNRDVFAVCGSIFDQNFAGCHQIIQRGSGKLVTNAADILCELGMGHAIEASGETTSSFVAENQEEAAVFSVLTTMPMDLDDLTVKAKLDAAVLNATLTMLELRGVVKNVGSGRWVRV